MMSRARRQRWAGFNSAHVLVSFPGTNGVLSNRQKYLFGLDLNPLQTETQARPDHANASVGLVQCEREQRP